MMKKGWILMLAVIFAVGFAGTTYASDIDLGGSLRVRANAVDNEDRATGNTGEGFIEQRTRINVSAGVNDTTRVFIQLNNSTGWGGDGTSAGTGTGGTVGLSQGYLELSDILDQPLTVRLGRQALAYGNHRLVGSLEWSNNARRFDALKLIFEQDAFSVDAWTAYHTATDGDQLFSGIYLTLKNIPDNTIDVYVLNDVRTAPRNEITYGARVAGMFADLDYTAEIAAQTGDVTSTTEREALAYAIKAGYTFPDVMGLRVGAEYDSATGNEAGTTDNEAFNNLYPTNHYLYGFTDDINWTNIQAWSVNASIKPSDNLKVALEYWDYTADEPAAGVGDDKGTEINVKGNYKLNDSVSCEAAYAFRDAGDDAAAADYNGGAIAATQDASLAYLMINVNF